MGAHLFFGCSSWAAAVAKFVVFLIHVFLTAGVLKMYMKIEVLLPDFEYETYCDFDVVVLEFASYLLLHVLTITDDFAVA